MNSAPLPGSYETVAFGSKLEWTLPGLAAKWTRMMSSSGGVHRPEEGRSREMERRFGRRPRTGGRLFAFGLSAARLLFGSITHSRFVAVNSNVMKSRRKKEEIAAPSPPTPDKNLRHTRIWERKRHSHCRSSDSTDRRNGKRPFDIRLAHSRFNGRQLAAGLRTFE